MVVVVVVKPLATIHSPLPVVDCSTSYFVAPESVQFIDTVPLDTPVICEFVGASANVYRESLFDALDSIVPAYARTYAVYCVLEFNPVCTQKVVSADRSGDDGHQASRP